MGKQRSPIKDIAWLFAPYFVFLGCYIAWNHLSRPVSQHVEEKIVTVPQGATFNEVARLLYRERVIRSPYPFTIIAYLRGDTTRIKAGQYRLSGSMTPAQVLDVLVSGRVIQLVFTIPEGFNIYDIADLLQRSGLARKEDFLRLVHDPGFLKAMKIPGPSAEGFLYPDTYFIPAGMGLKELTSMFVNQFWTVWREKGFGKRLKETDRDLFTVITLASIVEKETRLDKERPLIASVFWNRLKRGMPLQADPTVFYGILVETHKRKRRLRWRDLRRRTPYNTYKIKGLPKGPICNPGKESIRAVLWPANTNYLYFVSKNNGTHHFSATLKEHNRAVNRYQKRRR